MNDFENYLQERGYIPLVYNTKNETLEPKPNNFYYSTMGYLYLYFVHKENNFFSKGSTGIKTKPVEVDGIIMIGLHEAGKPPVLITPKLNILATFRCGNKLRNANRFDACVHAVFAKYTNDEIFDSIMDNSVVLSIDYDTELDTWNG